MTTFGTWNTFFPWWQHRICMAPMFEDVLGPGPADEAEAAFAGRVEAWPKLELHTHLESSVSAAFYARLNAGSRQFADADLPALRAPFATWDEFSSAWFDNTRLIHRTEVIADMVVDFAAERARQHIVYAEPHISPLHFTGWRRRNRSLPPPLHLESLLRAYLDGVRTAQQQEPSVVLRLLVDAPWTAFPEDRAELLAVLAQLVPSEHNLDLAGRPIIVGIGIADREIPSKAAELAPFVAACRELGLKIDVHTGEYFGPEVHRETMARLAPDRVSHLMNGYDPAVLGGAAVNFCPLAGVYVGDNRRRLGEHPIRHFYELAGTAPGEHRFSVSCDDPLLFNLTLTLEFVALRRAFGWEDEFFQACMNSARQSVFCPAALPA